MPSASTPISNEGEIATVRIPAGPPPTPGWPVMAFLHGAGEHADAYAIYAEAATARGIAGIALSGPRIVSAHGRAWSDRLETTDAAVQNLVGQLGGHGQVDGDAIYLFGFSQGATHAFGLLTRWPERYLGAIALSPGDGPVDLPPKRLVAVRRPLYLAYGAREFRAFRQRALQWARIWRHAGNPCLLETHAGGHHLPADWFLRFPRIVDWLRGHAVEANATVLPAPANRDETALP